MVVKAFLSGTAYHASLQERRVAIVASGLVLAMCLLLIFTQFTVSNKRRRQRRSTTTRSHPSSRLGLSLSVRSGILAQAIATIVHTVIIITTASLNLLDNPVVSAARTTCMGVSQAINGILAWERFLVVHPDYEVGLGGRGETVGGHV